MRIYINLFLLFALNSIYAQIGIGTTSPNGALDINSSTNGVIVPNIALTSRILAAPVVNPNGGGAPLAGTLVWNTQTSGVSPNNVVPGFYYWDGATWIAIAGDGGKNWTTTGNTGTSSATNFLGTTNNIDFVIKRNNVRAGFIGDPTYDSNYNSTNGNTAFGANTLLNPTINFASQLGVRNTAIGVNVMPGLTTGRINVGVGEFALFSNTTGIGNTSIGSGSLYSNIAGASNVAIGRNALTTSNSDNNTAVGFAALRQNISGTNNTSIGFEALKGVLGSGNIGVGYQAGSLETGSNKLYIENSNADANNALIYGEFNNNIARINGQLQIGNQSTTGYNFPTTRGTNGQTLQTNAFGTVSWTNSIANLSLIRVKLNADQILNSIGWQKITFDTTTFDINSEFNVGTSRFTATKTGYYEINAGIHTLNKTDVEYYGIAVYKNNAEYQETSSQHYGDKIISRTINCVVYLIAGDYIEIFFHCGLAPTRIDSYSGKTYFEVKQIK